MTLIAATFAALLTAAPLSCLPATPAPAPVKACQHVAIIGDSLTAQGNGALHRQFPDAIINARGGRTTVDAVEAAQGIVESNPVDCWVFALGTNDLYYDLPANESRQAIADLLAISGRDHVAWVTVEYGPGPYFQAAPERFNSLIPAGVIIVAPGVAATQSVDGVHLTGDGYDARADAIMSALP